MKLLIISGCVAVIAIILGILSYMYLDTSCDTYVIKVVSNKIEVAQSFHTKDTVEADRQIKSCMESLIKEKEDNINYAENGLTKSIDKLIRSGFTGNIEVILYGDEYDIINYYTNFNTIDLITQTQAWFELLEEYTNTSYGVVTFKHNHFWKPKKVSKNELTKQLLNIKKHKDKTEEAERKYKAEIYYKIF